MSIVKDKTLISQAEYVKKLRPFLPAEAFIPDQSKLVILFINLMILMLGWGIAKHLDSWPVYLLLLYIPLAVVMGNSVIVLLFSSHELMHGSLIKNPRLRRIVHSMGSAIAWMPPTLWKAVHNKEHHHKTNSLLDPDRSYLYEQPNNWGKWFQHLIEPSNEVNPIMLTLGMPIIWILYTFRNLTSVLLFNSESVNYVPAAFRVSTKERRAIASELFLILTIHLSILTYLEFNPLKLILSYFLPLGIGYAGAMFYIYTNHMLCQMTSINDPLLNSVSLKVPKLFDQLHFNFSYHTEHHIFPGINSDYYPLVQDLLKTHYPGRMNSLSIGDAWHLLLTTPRHYKNENTFTDWSGEKSITCPLSET